MDTETRRNHILAILGDAAQPVAGSRLAVDLSVSRQVIVQDIAILRASGDQILATSRGYILNRKLSGNRFSRTFAVRHDPADMEDELMTIVDAGGRVVDVIVEHPLYGELKGLLMLSSRLAVREFVKCLSLSKTKLLSDLTGGLHLHTVEAESEGSLSHIEKELARKGYLLEA